MVIIIVVIVIVVLLYAVYSKNKKNRGRENFQAVHNEIERLEKLLNENREKIENLKGAPSSKVVKDLFDTHNRLKSSMNEMKASIKDNTETDNVDNVSADLKKIEAEVQELLRKTNNVKTTGSVPLNASQGGKVTTSNTPNPPKPSYTIQNIPFLPKNEITIDYSTHCRIKYAISDSPKEDFPIIRAPKLGSYIKYPVTGRAGKRGASEEFFCNKIVEYGLQDHFYDNISLFVKNLGLPYEPDLAYIDVTKGVFLDIEIDEPYAGWDREPIHYKTVAGKTIDDLRNEHFTERGWTVIRFSEKQIREQTLSCLKSIFELLKKMDKNVTVPISLKDVPELKPNKWWTKEEAKRMADNKEREKLLGISKFIQPKNDTTASLWDYKEGKDVEKKIIEYKEDSCWRECKANDKYVRYETLFPQGKHIQELVQIKDNKLWEECKRQKDYKRYISCSRTSKYINEAKKLQQDKERQEMLEQQAIREKEERIKRETQRLEEAKRAQEARRREAEQRALQVQKIEAERQAREAHIREEERIKRETQRLEEEKRAQEARRREAEQRARDAQRYERQTVTTSTPPTRTPSSRGYA